MLHKIKCSGKLRKFCKRRKLYLVNMPTVQGEITKIEIFIAICQYTFLLFQHDAKV